jgi:tetratricopeptide (TPR) repeat protein
VRFFTFLGIFYCSVSLQAQVSATLKMIDDTAIVAPSVALDLIAQLDTSEVFELDSGYFYWFQKGRVSNALKEYEDASAFYQQAYDVVVSSKEHEKIAKVLHQLTRVENFTGRLVKSVEYANLALAHAKANYGTGIPEAYNDLGVANYYLRDYPAARDYFKLAKEEGLKRNSPNLVDYMRNCAVMFYEIDPEQADSSIYYLKPALALYGEDRLDDKATAFSLLGRYFLELEQMDSALYCLQMGVEMAKQSGNMQVYGTTLTQISNYYREMGELEKALELLKESYEYHKALNHYDGVQFASRVLMSVYKEMQNVDSAVHYMYQAQMARDTLFNRERANSLAEFEVQLNVAEKERQLAQANFEVSNQQNRILLLANLIILLLAGFIVWMIRNKANQGKKIASVKA